MMKVLGICPGCGCEADKEINDSSLIWCCGSRGWRIATTYILSERADPTDYKVFLNKNALSPPLNKSERRQKLLESNFFKQNFL